MKNRVKNYRMTNLLNQKELAQKIGVSNALISKIESGEIELTVKTARKIGNALNIDWRDLFDDDNQSEPSYDCPSGALSEALESIEVFG